MNLVACVTSSALPSISATVGVGQDGISSRSVRQTGWPSFSPEGGDERALLDVALHDHEVLPQDRRAGDAPLVVGVVEPAGVQHAEVALPQRACPTGRRRRGLRSRSARPRSCRRWPASPRPGSTWDGASSSARPRAPPFPRGPFRSSCRGAARARSATLRPSTARRRRRGRGGRTRSDRCSRPSSRTACRPRRSGSRPRCPGTFVFQSTPSPFVASHFSGVAKPFATPDATGPRNDGQSTPGRAPSARASAGASTRRAPSRRSGASFMASPSRLRRERACTEPAGRRSRGRSRSSCPPRRENTILGRGRAGPRNVTASSAPSTMPGWGAVDADELALAQLEAQLAAALVAVGSRRSRRASPRRRGSRRAAGGLAPAWVSCWTAASCFPSCASASAIARSSALGFVFSSASAMSSALPLRGAASRAAPARPARPCRSAAGRPRRGPRWPPS